MAKKKSQKRWPRQVLTAYHEAGHAVIAYERRVQFSAVSILKDGESLGRVVPRLWKDFDIDNNQSLRARYRLESVILVTLAGGAATWQLTGQHPSIGIWSDYPQAVHLAEKLHQDFEVVEPYLGYMVIRVKSMMGLPWTWAAVDALAQHLLEQKQLTKHQATRVIKNSHMFYRSNTGHLWRPFG
jgi:ATP-dependent Zn protease